MKITRRANKNRWYSEDYKIQLRTHPYGSPKMHWLTIRRKDDEPIHNWEDFQEIKNFVLGEEFEAFEIYPPESRLINMGNAYHLFAYKDKRHHNAFGFQFRKVLEEDDDKNESV